MKPRIKVAFASGTDDLNAVLVHRMRELFPELPLYVVSEFPPAQPDVKWVHYYSAHGFGENFARCRAAFRGKSIRLAGVLLVPSVPYRRMRLIALLLAPAGFLVFNEHFNNFMLRPGSAAAILRHLAWRARNFVRWHLRRAARPHNWRLSARHAVARLAGMFRPRGAAKAASETRVLEPGISVVIPSRDGKHLLAAQLPGLARQMQGIAGEIVVVDNGSTDGTAEYLRKEWPQVVVESSAAPLSFARAVNRGIGRARFNRVCLLNNDMLLEAGFFTALDRAFERVPDLFCASAQIRFPAGERREETGKTVFLQPTPEDFPIRSVEPLPGEDLSYVLYGSGGCSLYDAAKLYALGSVDEIYEPAYVEDLDLGYRAWQRGWPSVYVAGAVVEHRHRATTSRYYTEQQLARVLERNYLQFLARSVADGALFRRLWREACERLRRLGDMGALRQATAIARSGSHVTAPAYPEDLVLALTGGGVAVFPGRTPSGKPRVLIASPYVPYPLSHGAAVRIYNLMRRAATDFEQVLVAFSETLEPPSRELLDICAEIVVVRRTGRHSLPDTGRPETVEEFASPAFRAALHQTIRKWQPAVAQLEFTQMAQYAADCKPAMTLLVEHDVTFDLQEQLLALEEDWDLRRQAARWRSFETLAWQQVNGVIVMSARDRELVTGTRIAVLPNGVDLERFRPGGPPPEPRRLLFIGSFAHLPNRLAMEFFLREVWPLIADATLHIIAGAHHERHLSPELAQPRERVELEGFVADVRPAYHRATLVIAPLVASAGTNIKVLEAMAMGKVVVSTPAGVNGLDLAPGEDFVLVRTAADMAAAIADLLAGPAERAPIERAARARVERDYNWDEIARHQRALWSPPQKT